MGVIAVSPLRCRVWSLHPRLDENLTEESCRKELESFRKHGQLIPVLGRPLRGNADYDIELIYGARRLFVARQLSMPLQVEVREISDREGIVAMDAENRLRRDISPFERALSYTRWLREGHFRSQGEIASALQISHAQVSRVLKLARLPAVIVEAFSAPSDLCEAWGERLANLLADAQSVPQMLHVARQIALNGQRPPAEKIFAQLCAAAKLSSKARTIETAVTTAQGEELFRISRQRAAVVFKLPLERLSRELLAEIERALSRIVDPSLADDHGAAITVRARPPVFVARPSSRVEADART
jgi:ParB family transcriptional regulator, chromosome partitioning protein